MNDAIDLTFDLDQATWTSAFLASLGVRTPRHGASLEASTAWRALLDLRDDAVAMAARLARHPISRLLGLGRRSHHLAWVTVHDLVALSVESLAMVLEQIDVRDLVMVMRVHEDVLESLEKLVRSRLLSAASLRDLRRECEAVPLCWCGYREARERVTRVLRQMVDLGALPELETGKPC